MKTYLRCALALSAVALATQAAATCANGSLDWPTCTPPAAQPVAPTATANQGQSQGMGQHQGQGQGQSMSQGQSSTSNASSGATANGSVSVSTGGNTDNSRATAWAPVIHGPGAAAIAGAGIVTVSMGCGPRVATLSTRIDGKRFGVFGGVESVDQSWDETPVPSGTPFIEKDGVRYGHDVVVFSSVVGISSSASFSLGGFGRSGDGAQGGAAGSGGLQQIVMRFVARDCVMATQQPAPVVFMPAPTPIAACIAPPRHAYRKPAKKPVQGCRP